MHNKPRREFINRPEHTQSCDFRAYNFMQRRSSSSSVSEYTNSYLEETTFNSGVDLSIRKEIESNFHSSTINSSYKFPRISQEHPTISNTDRSTAAYSTEKSSSPIRLPISNLVKAISYKHFYPNLESRRPNEYYKDSYITSKRQINYINSKISPLRNANFKKIAYKATGNKLHSEFSMQNRSNRYSPDMKDTRRVKSKISFLNSFAKVSNHMPELRKFK